MIRALLVLAVAACGASKPQCPIAQPTTQPAPFLWKAHKNGDVVWLFGTIHDAGIADVPRVALEALDASPRLYTELGDVEPDPDVFRTHARTASGKGIDQLLPTDDWWDLRDALLGKIKEDELRRARPWYAMSLLSTYLAPSPGPSMDVQLAQRARARGKSVEYLETWQEQLATLDAAVGIADLQEAIHARKTMQCDLARLVAAYRTGDSATMQAVLVIPRTEATMLIPRNQKWLPTLEKQFGQGGAFVAVGLGHLLGDHGLVAMLQHAGYTVDRIAR